MPSYSESTLTQIKAAIDITSFIGECLPLQRLGSKFKALCPFHDDHNPSMEINPDRQSFKCWVCGAGGDLFDFVKMYERVEFPEAVKMLADRAGIVLEASRGEKSSGGSKTNLLEILAWAANEYQEALRNLPEAEEARNYFAKRGLNDQSVVNFGMGYAPDSRDWLIQKARKRGYSARQLEDAGFVSRNPDSPGILRERFRGRLLFPIHDARGRPIAFGGRILPEMEKRLKEAGRPAAKYLNSPETSLFQKRRTLYAAHLAKEPARKANWIAVVEGYTDVIAAHQVGLGNVVGTLGTALGDEHVVALRRMADQAVLIFDGDAAGQSAADRSLEIFLGHDLDVRILTLPNNLDPCDFLIERGSEPFLALVREAVDPLTHAIERAMVKFGLQGAAMGSGIALEKGRQAADWVISVLATIPKNAKAAQNFKVDKSLDILARRMSIPIADLHSWLKKKRQEIAARQRRADRQVPSVNPPVSERTALAPEQPLQRLSSPSSFQQPASAPAHAAASGENPPYATPASKSAVGHRSRDYRESAQNSPITLGQSPRELLAQLDPIDREIIQIALDKPEVVGKYLITRVSTSSVRNAPLRAILQVCYDLHGEGQMPSFDLVSLRLSDAHRNLAAALLLPFDSWPAGPGMELPSWEERLSAVLVRWTERERKDQIRELQAILAGMNRDDDPEEYDALRQEIYRLSFTRPDRKASAPSHSQS